MSISGNRISGNSFNVYTNARLPRGLSTGDTVHVSGMLASTSNANASLIRHR